MSLPGTDAPSPPTPAQASKEPRPAEPPGQPSAREAAAGVCPYLVSEGGAWRALTPTRDHRCSAVQPPTPQTTEKQRRHCLSSEHVECALFRAARQARSASLAPGSDPRAIEAADRRRRGLARTAPVVLEPPRLVDQVTRLRLDRAPGQVALIALMLVAFGVVAIARFSAGSAAADASALPSLVAVASATPRPTPTRTPSPSVSSSIAPSVAPSGGPSFRTTYTVKKGDTLVGIASKFKTTAGSIRSLNGMKSNTIKVGQVLKIP